MIARICNRVISNLTKNINNIFKRVIIRLLVIDDSEIDRYIRITGTHCGK